MDAKTAAALAVPGVVVVGGRELSIPPQTPADVARTYDEMRRQARAACTSPLALVNAQAADLAPGVLAEAIRAAVAIGAGGGVEPTREAVLAQYSTLDGVRWRLWYQARKAWGGLTREEVASLVTEENLYEVADALDDALGLKALDGGKGPPASGTNSP